MGKPELTKLETQLNAALAMAQSNLPPRESHAIITRLQEILVLVRKLKARSQ